MLKEMKIGETKKLFAMPEGNFNFLSLLHKKIGWWYVNDTNETEGYIDVEGHLGLNFNNGKGLDEEHIKDKKKILQIWDTMTNKLTSTDAAGKTEEGKPFEIYCTFDTSGFDYWAKDSFWNLQYTIIINTPKNATFTNKDLTIFEHILNTIRQKHMQILRKHIIEMNKNLKDETITISE
jgi:hypothetical protein